MWVLGLFLFLCFWARVCVLLLEYLMLHLQNQLETF